MTKLQIPAFGETGYFDEKESKDIRVVLLENVDAERFDAYCRLLEENGYTQLQIGIPLFARDRAQKLGKELYPDIAKLCGYGSSLAVERSIRGAIKAAWERRDDSLWRSYFHPDATNSIPCPSNKLFISTLAEIITLEISTEDTRTTVLK